MRFTINVETECDLGQYLASSTREGNSTINVRISTNVRPQDLHFVLQHETAHAVAGFTFDMNRVKRTAREKLYSHEG